MLARQAQGFEQARRGAPLVFPEDHGSHPTYRLEWWYLTANLRDASGREMGAQWTLFRLARRPLSKRSRSASEHPWSADQVYMAHTALSWPEGHQGFQRYARGGGPRHTQAGSQAEPFMVWLDDWEMKSTGAQWLPLTVKARQSGMGFKLTLSSDRALELQGEQGFSQKHPDGGGSYYYSQPHLEATGQITLHGESFEVRGMAWYDHEWSSQFLQPDQTGWDWFALHLDSGEKLMLYRLRSRNNTAYVHGSLLAADGSRTILGPAGLEFTVLRWDRVAGRDLPMAWQIHLPGLQRTLDLETLHPQQWMDVDFPYWEGVVRVTGDSPGERGRGFLEMTGYPKSAPP